MTSCAEITVWLPLTFWVIAWQKREPLPSRPRCRPCLIFFTASFCTIPGGVCGHDKLLLPLPGAVEIMHPLYDVLRGRKPTHMVDSSTEVDTAFTAAKVALGSGAMLNWRLMHPLLSLLMLQIMRWVLCMNSGLMLPGNLWLSSVARCTLPSVSTALLIGSCCLRNWLYSTLALGWRAGF